MDRWGKRKLTKTRLNGVRVFEVELLGGGIEEIELQPFLDFCLLCGQRVVDTRKTHGCQIGSKECCSICAEKCKEKHVCLLK